VRPTSRLRPGQTRRRALSAQTDWMNIPEPGIFHLFKGSSPPSDTIEKPTLSGLYLRFHDSPSRVVGQ
jgi:hypothetical protein